MNIMRIGFEYYEKYEKFVKFLIIGTLGTILNLGVTYLSTEFIFGREKYMIGFLLGLFCNIIFNFVNYFKLFKSKKKVVMRFTIFFSYVALYILLVTNLTKIIVDIVGLNFYMLVIASLTLFFAIINYSVFKLFIFK